MQIHFALEMDRTREESARRYENSPAARRRARIDRSANRIRAIHTAGLRTMPRDVEIAIGKSRRDNASENLRHEIPTRPSAWLCADARARMTRPRADRRSEHGAGTHGTQEFTSVRHASSLMACVDVSATIARTSRASRRASSYTIRSLIADR